MGQQQLLLVILVTIIVGIATVVAINIFGQAADQANRDAVRQDLMGAAVQAQAIWARPVMMNGAGRDFSDTDALTNAQLLQRLNIPGAFDDGETEINNENGRYWLTGIQADELTINAEPTSGGPNITARVFRDDNDNWDIDIQDAAAAE
jgi:hypothetical protein